MYSLTQTEIDYDNGIPRKIFMPEIDEETGGLRKGYNGALHNLYPPPDIVRAIK
jgi:hypothetical protein